jgi:hypothetical protein
MSTPIGQSSKARFAYLDHSAEVTHTALHFEPLFSDASNVGVLDTPAGSVALIGTALALITKLPQAGTTMSVQLDTSTPSIPTDATAQRETAIRWTYADTTTGKKYRFDVPAPIDDIVPTGTDEVNMASLDVIAFKAVFDAEVRSEVGNGVALISGRFVGRHN